MKTKTIIPYDPELHLILTVFESPGHKFQSSIGLVRYDEWCNAELKKFRASRNAIIVTGARGQIAIAQVIN